MSLVSVTKISSLMLASVAEEASLSLTWSETPEDTFSHDEARIRVGLYCKHPKIPTPPKIAQLSQHSVEEV